MSSTAASTTTPSATTTAASTTAASTTAASTTAASTTTPSATTTAASTPSASASDENYYNNQTMVMTIAFLGIYFAVYAISGMFFKNGDPNYNSNTGGTVDLIVLVIVIILSIVYYVSLSDSDRNKFFDDLKKGVRDYFNNAYSILEVTIFIILFQLGVYLLKIPISSSVFEYKAFIWLFLLVAVQFFKYVLDIRIVDHIYNWDLFEKKKVEIQVVEKETEEPKETEGPKNEVFNISNNLFTFDDAQRVCKSFDARLATYDEIEDAYENGAEWSTYGWSKDQHAYFPTQKDTWSKLQDVKGHEHDLGRPGVNGGYFKNPNIRFGVNCFGIKPAMTDSEKARMDARKEQVYPKSKEDELLDKKVKFFQDNKDKLLVINGYNTDKWSRY
jgi:hypothetical protein